MATRLLSAPRGTVRIYADANELAQKAAQHFAQLADQYVLGHGRFSVALPGGSTPKGMLAALAAEPYCSTIPWESVFIYWSDERCVPPDHPQSNYGMAKELLLAHVPIPAENIARMRGEHENPDVAASLYADKLSMQLSGQTLASQSAPLPNMPRFDLVMLGMGIDGHTASLFPNSSALQVTHTSVIAIYVEILNAYRLTLTLPALNNARHVTFLVAGAEKADLLAEIITPHPVEKYPCELIKPGNGSLLWLADEAAAARLKH